MSCTVVRKGHKCASLPLHEPEPTHPEQSTSSMLFNAVRMKRCLRQCLWSFQGQFTLQLALAREEWGKIEPSWQESSTFKDVSNALRTATTKQTSIADLKIMQACKIKKWSLTKPEIQEGLQARIHIMHSLPHICMSADQTAMTTYSRIVGAFSSWALSRVEAEDPNF